MVKKIIKKKVCCLCNNKILQEERYVLLGTYEDRYIKKVQKVETDVFEERWYHIQCWKNYMKEMIDSKIENIRKGLMQNAGALAGNLMKNIRGMPQ